MKRNTQKILLFFSILLITGNLWAQDDPFGKFVNNGLRLSKMEQYTAAIKEFELAITISDTSSQVYYFKGLCYFKLKDADNAIADFEAALKRNEQHINSYLKLLTCYRIKKDLDNTVYTYDRMFNIIDDPRKKTDLKAKAARLLLAEKKLDLALQHVEMGLQVDPSHVGLLYYKGKILNTKGDYEAAQTALSRGLTTLDWRDVKLKTQLNYELGYSLHKQEKYKESTDAFKNANYGPYKSRVAMFTPSFYGKVAKLTADMHDYQKSLELINIALAMESDFPPALELKKNLLGIIADHSKEVEAYQKVLAAGIDDKRAAEIYNKVVDLLIGSEKYDEAVAIADQCLTKFPESTEVRFMKSMALLQANKPAEAIQVLANMIGKEGIDPRLRAKYEFGVGLCFMAQNDIKSANDHFNKIIKTANETGGFYVAAALFERNQLDIDEDEEDLIGEAPSDTANADKGAE